MLNVAPPLATALRVIVNRELLWACVVGKFNKVHPKTMPTERITFIFVAFYFGPIAMMLKPASVSGKIKVLFERLTVVAVTAKPDGL